MAEEDLILSADTAALFAVIILAGIVAWDAFWLTRQRQDIPQMGELKKGGFCLEE